MYIIKIHGNNNVSNCYSMNNDVWCLIYTQGIYEDQHSPIVEEQKCQQFKCPIDISSYFIRLAVGHMGRSFLSATSLIP